MVEPGSFALNRRMHKLYVANAPGFVKGVKVIDTASRAVIGGLDLGWYREPGNRFIGRGMAVDESSGPGGNKVYVVGGPWDRSTPFVLRVVDGESDTSLTGEGTDIVLPIAPAPAQPGPDFPSVVVNPTNHKVYVSTNAGEIAVIDGENRTVLKTLNPDAGSFLAVDPVANKIFVLGRNGGAIIDSATDTVSPPPRPLDFQPRSAAFNEANNRIYVVATAGLFVLDGSTGELVASRIDFGWGGNAPVSIAVVPNENTIYLGTETKIHVVNADDLSSRGELPHSATALAWDPASPGVLYAIIPPISGSYYSDNAVRVVDRQSGAEVRKVTTAYMPSKIALNTQTNRVYVIDSAAPELTVLDGNEHAVIARVSLPTARLYTRDLAVAQQLNRIYVRRETAEIGSGARYVDVIDGETNQLRSSFRVPDFTADIIVDETRARIYVSYARVVVLMPRSSTAIWALQVYDANTETLISSFDASGSTSGGNGTLAFNPVTGRIYMVTGENQITAIDSNTLAPIGNIAIEKDTRLTDLAVNTTTNKLYLGGTGDVTVVNGETNSVENVFKTGRDNVTVRNIVADEEADVVYLVDDGRVAMFEGSNGNAFLGEKAVGQSGGGLAFRPGARELFVGNVDNVVTYQNGSINVLHATGRSRLANLATRMRVGSGEAALISGLIVTGPQGSTNRVVLRAIGPSLQSAGLTDALADPTLELVDAAGKSVTNDDWKINASTGASQQAEVEATGLAPTSGAEAGLVADLAPGAYTAIVRGKHGATGTGLAEVYDLDLNSSARLANIATRGHVGAGDAAMIGGVIVNGSGPARVLIRAIGPSLGGQLGGVLDDPVLELRNADGEVLDANDDWKSDNEAGIAATTIPPSDERESAIVAGLFPGQYTAIVRGKGEAAGIAVVEAYQLQ